MKTKMNERNAKNLAGGWGFEPQTYSLGGCLLIRARIPAQLVC